MKPAIIFDIHHVPPGIAIIERVRVRATKMVRISLWLIIPMVALSIYVATAAGQFIQDYGSESKAHQFMVEFGSFFTGVCVFLMIIGVFYSWITHWKDEKWLVDTINIADAEEAFSLSQQYVEIEAYRKTVVAEREIVKGDFKAMKRFAEDETQKVHVRSMREKEEEAFRRLHQVS